METHIRVIESEGQKMFECAGVKFNAAVTVYFLPDKTTIRFYRAGTLFDQGRVGLIQLWPDQAREDLMFLDFTREELTNGGKYFSRFDVNDLQLNDELVIDGLREEEYLHLVVEHFLTIGWNPYRWALKTEFPYPLTWREDRDSARKVWKAKVARTYADIASGKLAFLNFNGPIPTREKKPTQFVIEVRKLEKKKYFFFGGIYFNALPLIHAFWEADMLGGCEIEIYRGRHQKRIGTIGIHEVGTHGATLMFTSWDKMFPISDREYAIYAQSLRVKNFSAGYRLILTTPIAFDLVEGLAEYVGSDKIPALAPLVALCPHDYKERRELFPGADHSFGEDLSFDFAWRLRDRKVELVKTGQVTVLEFTGME